MKLRVLLASIAMFFNSMAIAAPDWLRDGRIGGTSISSSMNQSELIALIDQRASENVSVLELDSRLSEYLTDAEFDVEVAFIDRAAELAHERGLKAVIYYPGLEVLTQNGVNLASTMYKDHPEWIQKGIGGAPNVFYGNQEVWVDPNAESAWLSPNTGYLDYFLERIAKLAATDVDGVWVDVPIYLETGAGWAGAEPEAAADFTAWTIAEGLNPPNGYTVPSSADFNSPAFRSWV